MGTGPELWSMVQESTQAMKVESKMEPAEKRRLSRNEARKLDAGDGTETEESV